LLVNPPASEQQTVSNELRAIEYGQDILKTFTPTEHGKGHAGTSHAVIWTLPPASSSQTVQTPEVVECGDDDLGSMPLHAGNYCVYRPHDSNLGDWAAQAALVLADYSQNTDKILYDYKKVAQSAWNTTLFGNSFDGDAQAFIKRISADLFLPKRPDWAPEGSFCTETVVAVYQGAALRIDQARDDEHLRNPQIPLAKSLAPVFPVHASNTIPMRLHHELAVSADFKKLGEMTC
jgi:hypothetical protein